MSRQSQKENPRPRLKVALRESNPSVQRDSQIGVQPKNQNHLSLQTSAREEGATKAKAVSGSSTPKTKGMLNGVFIHTLLTGPIATSVICLHRNRSNVLHLHRRSACIVALAKLSPTGTFTLTKHMLFLTNTHRAGIRYRIISFAYLTRLILQEVFLSDQEYAPAPVI